MQNLGRRQGPHPKEASCAATLQVQKVCHSRTKRLGMPMVNLLRPSCITVDKYGGRGRPSKDTGTCGVATQSSFYFSAPFASGSFRQVQNMCLRGKKQHLRRYLP